MIKSLFVYTEEIDDVECAVGEIMAQIEAGGALLTHSIGLISCYSEFIDSGVVSALAKSLPFKIVGCTTLATAIPYTDELMSLALHVLTGDDVSFDVGVTEPISDEDMSIISNAYAETVGCSGDPALIISYAPLLLNVGGDFFVNAMTQASGGIPNFGTITVDDTMDYRNAYVIANGEAYKDRYAFVLVSGDIRPKFYLASLTQEKIFREIGVVTDAEGNRLKRINDMSAEDYLLTLGLQNDADGNIEGVNSFPFIVDFDDGTEPVVRIIFAITPEGYAVCGGDIPMGAKLSVGSIDANEVVKATSDTLTRIIAAGNTDVMLAFSCVGRYFSLGYQPTREADCLREKFGALNMDYILQYSGGEICPVYGTMGDATTNRFHNDTFIACTF